MNIWEAYCNPSYYNVYFEFLKAKGIKPEEAENLKEQYCVYLQRIKGTILGIDLEDITTKEVFLDRLKDIFYVKWAGKVKYQSMPAHYEHYLTFLDTMQVLHNDFINDKEEERLINLNINIPVKELTEYETQYLIDSKLVALANPQLLYILKRYIENHGIASKRLALVCKEFYGDLLPKMESEDYVRLISMLWTSSHQVKKGGGAIKSK